MHNYEITVNRENITQKNIKTNQNIIQIKSKLL